MPAVGLGVGIRTFVVGDVNSGLAVLAVSVVIYARIPAAIGAAIGARSERGRT